jgi:hypothetical protein
MATNGDVPVPAEPSPPPLHALREAAAAVRAARAAAFVAMRAVQAPDPASGPALATWAARLHTLASALTDIVTYLDWQLTHDDGTDGRGDRDACARLHH